MTPIITEYRYGTDQDVKNHLAIYVQYRGNNRYVVTRDSEVLASNGVWEWEPSSSECDDTFINRTRYTLDMAQSLATLHYENQRYNNA